MTDRIENFDGEYRFLSNFWPENNATLEHLYQAAKTGDPEWKTKILSSSTPGKAKKLGRNCPINSIWDDVKIGVMFHLLCEKFSIDGPHPELVGKLLATGDAKLVEGNYWHDQFWGVCEGTGRNRKCPGHAPSGDNWLGRLLMVVRSQLIISTVESGTLF